MAGGSCPADVSLAIERGGDLFVVVLAAEPPRCYVGEVGAVVREHLALHDGTATQFLRGGGDARQVEGLAQFIAQQLELAGEYDIETRSAPSASTGRRMTAGIRSRFTH